MSSINNLKLGEPIPYSQVVPASMDRVWQVISEPGNLVYFHPFCESNPVEAWPGVGSSDKVCYYNGLVLERDFTNWIEGSCYNLMASAEEGLQFKVTWRITGERRKKRTEHHHSAGYRTGIREKGEPVQPPADEVFGASPARI